MHHQPRGTLATGHWLVVLVQAGLEQAIGYGIELGLHRPIVALAHPVDHAMISHAAVDRRQFQDIKRVILRLLGPQQLRCVVAGKVCPGKITIGDLAGEPLRHGQAHRLRNRGQEDPKIVTFHQQDLPAVGSRLCDHDNRVFVPFGQDPIPADIFRRAGTGRGDRDGNLEGFDRETDMVRFLDDRLGELVVA